MGCPRGKTLRSRGLPDNDVASPAVRRAVQPASGIEQRQQHQQRQCLLIKSNSFSQTNVGCANEWMPHCKIGPGTRELHVIRRLNHSLYGTGGRRLEPGCAKGPLARSHPPAEHVSLAPLRCDVPLLDHCCGQLSAGAEVVLGVKGRQKFIDFHHVASALRVPPGFGERPQTAPSPSGVCVDSIGAEWNRQQLRLRNDAKKPISFGAIGSENMDNIDNMDENFQPLTLRRSIVPPYTPTARRTTIPGYTGKAAYADSGADAAVSVLAVSTPARSSGWASFERTLPAFGAGISRWLNPEQLVESARRLGDVMSEQTSRLQELRRQLCSGSGSGTDQDQDLELELQAAREELRLALRREKENQERSGRREAELDSLSRALRVKEGVIRVSERDNDVTTMILIG
ncbi:hypothetical protein F2P81_019959 [Scophthalmus maximus]|uniref:Uncharacterized protein n=2 Tax=Scophthalmus maximus TaxID=52904 RepID=A0A6A4S4V7_SCOMX|nr:hypothetical protein F2P81_019959 [Scophthalmus maximus]